MHLYFTHKLLSLGCEFFSKTKFPVIEKQNPALANAGFVSLGQHHFHPNCWSIDVFTPFALLLFWFGSGFDVLSHRRCTK